MKTERQAEAQTLQRQGLTRAEIAERMGMTIEGVKSLLRRARKWDDAPSALAAGAAAIGADTPASITWAKQQADGSVRYSVMHSNKPEPPDPEEYADAVVQRFRDIPPAPPIVQKHESEVNTLALHIVTDLHYGKSVTKSETGTDYNREIAAERVRSGFSASVAAVAPAETAVILWNGDTTDADNNKRVTPKNGHHLMVEGTHQSNKLDCVDLCAWQVDSALERHGEVILVAKPGNHDPNTPAAIIAGMEQRYRNNDRVTVIRDENPVFTLRKDRLFIASHHGDCNVKTLADGIKFQYRREWGKADFHHLFTGDKHNFKAESLGGLRWHQIPSICSLDQYANHSGYTDDSGMVSMRFNCGTGQYNAFNVYF